MFWNLIQRGASFLLVALLCVSLSFAQPVPGIFNPLLVGSDASGTITFTDDSTQITVNTVHTYTTQAFGSAFADRIIVVAAQAQANGAAITSCSSTIGGVAATQAIFANSGALKAVGIYAAAVPTGTTGTVVLTCNQNIYGSAIAVYSLANIASVTATDSGSNNANPTVYALDVTAGGVAVAIVADYISGTTTWTNLTEDVDSTCCATISWSAASKAFATTQTNLSIEALNSAPSVTNPEMVTASFR